MIKSGLFYKDYVGAEIWFPKGNPNSQPLKVDACVFDHKDWLKNYLKWRDEKDYQSLQFLKEHCIMAIEFKRMEDSVEQTFHNQLKPAMKESECTKTVGVIYNAGRLYLFQKRENRITWFDDLKNKNGSSLTNLSAELPDPYNTIPSFYEIQKPIETLGQIDRSNRSLDQLDSITSRLSTQLTDALNQILRTLEEYSISEQSGYRILIQTIAMKIFDEKRNKDNASVPLRFYVTSDELEFENLHDAIAQNFVTRMNTIYQDAETRYSNIFRDRYINWQKETHVRIVQSVIKSFQDYSFVNSERTDLYQLVFYNFAQPFQRNAKAQFLTPLSLIEFLVKIVNPRGNESVCDPCVGIADFLSLSFVCSEPKLCDENLWGVDNDNDMIVLSQLNMLLNGDGRAHLLYAEGDGSLRQKISTKGTLVRLIPRMHRCQNDTRAANWDQWSDGTKLLKFDVVLTNPPFGRGRAYRPENSEQKDTINMYETYWMKNRPASMDKGVLFLENAYHILKNNGRLGIVLSNAIASVESNKKAIEWLLKKMRIVAVFDFPPDVFAETGVNTTVIIAYKAVKNELNDLISQNYSIFARNISKVGYTKKTKQRNVVFEPAYKISCDSFEVQIDSYGNPILDEEFTTIEKDFQVWTKTQEQVLQVGFIGDAL